MMRRTPVLLLVAAVLGACSSPAGPSPTPTPPPGPATTTVEGTVTGYGITSHSFTPAQAGSLTATLTWTGAADLDLYVTAASCTGYPPDACVILARAASSSGTREEVTLAVTSGTPLQLWVDNFHPTASVGYTLATIIR
jgi:hypothetical protein